jgi:hypothetical protein
MIKRLVVLVTILSGLSAGLSLSHVLEIPGKESLDAMTFVHVQQTFYGGYATFGAIVWLAVPIVAVVAAWKWWHNHRAAALSCVVAASCFVVALVIFGLFLNSYNHQIASWAQTGVPADWQTIRQHWDMAHTVIFGLSLVAFGALLQSLNSLRRL